MHALYRSVVSPNAESGIQQIDYTYQPNSNRLVKWGDTQIIQDVTGNRLGSVSPDSQEHFIYNHQNRPVTHYKNKEAIARYGYNSLGQRVFKQLSDNNAIVFHYDQQGQLLGESAITAKGIQHTNYVWFERQPIAQIQSNTITYIHTDHLNTPRLATNQKQQAVWQWQSDAFGVGKANQDVDKDGKLTVIPLRFPGQYHDEESGLFYNYYRTYDPTQGRYTQSDPIGLRGGINTFAYVGGNPLLYGDPLGLFQIPTSQAESDALISQLSSYNQAQIAQYVATELDDFSDREAFYLWNHQQLNYQPNATQSNWFLAASQVNELDALGGVGQPLGTGIFDPFSSETQAYLEHAGLELAEHNINTFVRMVNGGSVVNVCFIDTLNQDLYLVEYEQQRLESITNSYFASNTGLDRNEIMMDINDVFNHVGIGGALSEWFGDEAIQTIIDDNFHNASPPVDFDINNIQHRIILGQEMVRLNDAN